MSIVLALALTAAAVVLVGKLARRLNAGPASTRIPFEIVQRISCGPRQGMALVRVGDRILVVSMAEGGARLLTELTRDEAAVALPPATEVEHSTGPGLWSGLARLSWVVAVLAVGGGPAAAQVQDTGGTDGTASLEGVAPQFRVTVGDDDGTFEISGAVGVVVFMSVLTVLPAVFLMMTSFTRILIVLHFLRAALGTQTTPPGQLLVAMALLLTGIVMAPVLNRAHDDALRPYLDGELSQAEAYQAAVVPFREFMLANTKGEELGAFAELGGHDDVATIDDLPTVTVMSSFVTSELKTAFQIGFVIFMPFIVVDLLVASVLMSMGMFMLPPVMISLPFKLLLFVLADGWTLVAENLVAGFAF